MFLDYYINIDNIPLISIELVIYVSTLYCTEVELQIQTIIIMKSEG